MRRTAALLLASVTLTLLPSIGSAGTATRLYLLSSSHEYLYWSPDASDPELNVASLTRTCSYPPVYGTAASAPCLSGPQPPGGFIHSTFFEPAALLDAPITWTTPTSPRFHLSLTSLSASPVAVHLLLQRGLDQIESAAAQEVSPGVFEGTFPAGALDPAITNLWGIRIRTLSPAVSLTLGTAGASYIEFAAPIAARAVPELLAADDPPTPQTFQTPQRAFTFDDDQWQVHTFAGDLTTSRTFTVPLSSRAPVVYAWAESFQDPFTGHLLRTHEVDQRRVTDRPVVRLSLDGQLVTQGANSVGQLARGMDTVAAVDVGPGVLGVEVSPGRTSGPGDYALYVLTAGARTMRTMTWRFTHVENEPLIAHRSVTSAFCNAASEPIAVPREVTTFAVTITHETPDPLPERWTLRYALPDVGTYPCGESGTGTTMRFTVPQGARVWGFGPVPPRNTMFASHRMTTFTLNARFTYGD